MSYLVLARKYRPQTFEEVAGQEHVTRTLQNAIRAGRLAHAYLFAGPRGVGKTSVARILAKAINCPKNSDGTPCNACPACEEITAGTSVDVIEIDGASNRGVDAVRELRESVRYAPARLQYKVYIIDEVHMLTNEAFNALLKTLEEPPAHVVFLFATTEPHKVLPTILSRCQRFDFRRLTLSDLEKQLSQVLGAEKLSLEPGAVQLVARLCEGGMRDALSLLDLVTASLGGPDRKAPITEQEVADLAGVAGRALVEQVLEGVTAGDGAKILAGVEKLYNHGYDVRHFYGEVLGALRDALVIKQIKKDAAEVLNLDEETAGRLSELFRDWDAPQIDQLFVIFQSGEAAVFNSSHQRYVLETLLLRMSQVSALDVLGTLGERLDRIEQSLGGGAPVRAGAPASSGPASEPPRRRFEPPAASAPAAPAPSVSKDSPKNSLSARFEASRRERVTRQQQSPAGGAEESEEDPAARAERERAEAEQVRREARENPVVQRVFETFPVGNFTTRKIDKD